MTDFIIVGQGLAANVLMHTFHKYGISFKTVGDPGLSNCSRVAAGIWNPLVFKRMTKSWLADDVVPYLTTFYGACEQELREQIITTRPLVKPFTEDHEKDLWVKKAKAELRNYLDAEIKTEPAPQLEHCRVNNGYGVVEHCGNLNVARFLKASHQYFNEKILSEVFNYSNLQISPAEITYGGTISKNIIFCEGHLVRKNPYFNWIPLKPAKGEILTLQIPGLSLKNTIFNKNGFLMGLGSDIYKMGATYEWQDLTETPSEKGLTELITKLEEMIDCRYAIQKQDAGIRPSAIDRRPLIGKHPHYQNVFVFNGLGTKGVMLAPYFANNFVNFYLQKEPLNKEVDLSRFYNLYETFKT